MSKKLSAYHFFLKHAGFAYDPKTETKAQGQVRCAKALAKAEREAQKARIRFDVDYDDDPDTSWMDSEQLESLERGDTVFVRVLALKTCECGRRNNVKASLYGIHVTGFNDPYLRVIKAELAQEALV